MEHVMGKLNYRTDFMTRWRIGWIAGSENKAHGKMASLFAQPYISPPDYDTVDFSFKKETVLAQRALSMSISDASKATRRLVKMYHRSESMLAA
jgi:hypothetical protein